MLSLSDDQMLLPVRLAPVHLLVAEPAAGPHLDWLIDLLIDWLIDHWLPLVHTSLTLPEFMKRPTAFCSLALSNATWRTRGNTELGKEEEEYPASLPEQEIERNCQNIVELSCATVLLNQESASTTSQVVSVHNSQVVQPSCPYRLQSKQDTNADTIQIQIQIQIRIQYGYRYK